MAIRPSGTALRQFRTLFHLGATGDLTDGQLLERFATAPGEAAELAFAVLVERHGPLVLRTCLAVLRDGHDAEDAFQATFLVLARKARSLWVRDSIGPWLHAVALRAARCSRASRDRRRGRERPPDAIDTVPAAPESPLDDLGPALHEEVDRLPGRYRGPIVLCDLEGLTHEQAARRLGCPVGTVKSRLSRGRLRLRDRLARRGLAPSVGAVVAAGSIAAPGAAAVVPASVARSAVAASMQAASHRLASGAIPAAVALLAEGVSKAMILSQLKAITLPTLALVVAAGAGVSSWGEGPPFAPREAAPSPAPPIPSAEVPRDDDPMPVFVVDTGALDVFLSERGSLEGAGSARVNSPIEGQATILMLLPEGTRVVEGQLVCELDSTALKDRLANQQIVVERARADRDNAAKTLEVAELDVQEYRDVTYPQEVKTIEGEIKLYESELERAGERLSWSDDMRKLGYLTQTQNHADKYELQRARFNLEQSKQKLEVLRRYTMPKRLKGLETDSEQARADLQSKKTTWEVDQEKERALREQIEQCRILAPSDGIVIYESEFGAGQANREGATVRERQLILTIFDPGDGVRVNTKVHESRIARVKPGMTAQVRVHAFPNNPLDGRVTEVKPLPDPTRFFERVPKIYTTMVEVEDPHPGLRPGMTADVVLLVDRLVGVTRVPIRAVLRHDGKDLVAVKGPAGAFEPREVTLGQSDGRFAEVRQGLRPGDLVAADPIALLRRGSKPELPDAPIGLDASGPDPLRSG